MSYIKHWMAETEDAFWEVYTPEASVKDIIRKVRKKLRITDESFIERLYREAREN